MCFAFATTICALPIASLSGGGILAYRLPVLEARAKELETCVFCPKLCRAACPVSNVTAREPLIPWGKMTSAYALATERSPIDADRAETAWACTSCYACRELCEHKNPVADTLLDARAALAQERVEPAAAREVAASFSDRSARYAHALGSIESHADGVPFVVGCGYALYDPALVRDIADVARRWLGRVRVVRACCGLSLDMSGDRRGAAAARRKLDDALGSHPQPVFVDPGCAKHVSKERPVELLLDVVARDLSPLRPLSGDVPRYHDPCQLGRGLGRFQEPRAILSRIFGQEPREFVESRECAACSGAGGLLPRTMPEVARDIGAARWSAHEREGGGQLVTACGSSLRMFRRFDRGRVSDIHTCIARSIS